MPSETSLQLMARLAGMSSDEVQAFWKRLLDLEAEEEADAIDPDWRGPN